MGHKRDRTGIDGFFDDLEEPSQTKPTVEPNSVTKPVGTTKSKKPSHRRTTKSRQEQTHDDRKTESPLPKRGTPTGRPPGRQDGKGPLKRRTTLWLPVELMDAYRERTWHDRCHLNEIVERALQEYREQNWRETK